MQSDPIARGRTIFFAVSRAQAATPPGKSTDHRSRKSDTKRAGFAARRTPARFRRAEEGLANEAFDRADGIRESAPPGSPRPADRGSLEVRGQELAASITPKTGRPHNRRQTKGSRHSSRRWGRGGRRRSEVLSLRGSPPRWRDGRHRRQRHGQGNCRRPYGRSRDRDRKARCGRGTTPLSWWLKNRQPAATHASAGFAIFQASIAAPWRTKPNQSITLVPPTTRRQTPLGSEPAA
jgi:hypothetical protein